MISLPMSEITESLRFEDEEGYEPGRDFLKYVVSFWRQNVIAVVILHRVLARMSKWRE